MKTLDAIFTRKTTRSYDGRQIPERDLEIILNAGCSAPIALAKYDDIQITVVQNEKLLKSIFDKSTDILYKVYGMRKNQDFGSKTLVCVSQLGTKPIGMEYANAGFILENMVLAATSLGIDSVVLGSAARAIDSDEELKKELEIKTGYNVILCASFGYATTKEEPKKHVISINRL